MHKILTWVRHNPWLLLSIIVSLLAGASLLTTKHFNTHDDIQIYRLNEFIKCFQDGQIPCRWSSDMGKGYGYPYFIFYPPLIYLIPSLIHLFTNFSLVTSLNLSAYLTFPLAAYAMYLLVSKITGKNWLGAVSSLLYTLSPYHALNIFVRGVYAENLAWAIFPLLLLWSYNWCTKHKSLFPLALGITTVFLTHNISAMIMLPIMGIWVLTIMVISKNQQTNNQTFIFKTLLGGIGSFLLAIGLSSFFLIPALIEKNLVQTESMIFDYYSYLNHFVSFRQLFFSNYWGYGGSSFGTQFDEMSFGIGYFIFLGSILLAFLIAKSSKIYCSKKVIFYVLFLLGFFLLFMTHARSTFIWRSLPLLAYLQFPWRFLGVATTILILAIGYGLHLFPPHKARYLSISLVALALIFSAPHFHPEKYDSYQDQDYLNGIFTADQQTAHLYDYLPKTVHSIPDEVSTSPIFKFLEPLTVLEYNQTSNHKSIKFNNSQAQDIILSQYAYPGWTAYLDDNKITYHPDPNYGFIMVNIPPGIHTIELSWFEQGTRLFSDYLSLISLGAVIVIIVITRKRAKHVQ